MTTAILLLCAFFAFRNYTLYIFNKRLKERLKLKDETIDFKERICLERSKEIHRLSHLVLKLQSKK